jgi:hypothetical protein
MKQSKEKNWVNYYILFSQRFSLYLVNATKNQIAKGETIEISIKDFGNADH